MKQITNNTELDKLLDYLKEDIHNCVYIFLDLSKYKCDNQNVEVWIHEENNTYDSVIMKYYDGFQVYTRNKYCNVEPIIDLLERFDVQRITGTEAIIEQLQKKLSLNYVYDAGIVVKRNKPYKKRFSKDSRCRFAKSTDIVDIVRLLREDPGFRAEYHEKELMKQFEDRYNTKMGRSMIFLRENEIVGHIGTFAEIDNIAVVSGSIMKREYRDTEYFDILSDNFFDIICNDEEKEAYSFVVNTRHIKLCKMQKLEYTTYGRLVKE